MKSKIIISRGSGKIKGEECRAEICCSFARFTYPFQHGAAVISSDAAKINYQSINHCLEKGMGQPNGTGSEKQLKGYPTDLLILQKFSSII